MSFGAAWADSNDTSQTSLDFKEFKKQTNDYSDLQLQKRQLKIF